MACYQSEVRPYPHPRSLEALRNRAKAWGNQCCLDAAEVFMTVRRLVRNDDINSLRNSGLPEPCQPVEFNTVNLYRPICEVLNRVRNPIYIF